MRRALLGRSVALVRDVGEEADRRGEIVGVAGVRAPDTGVGRRRSEEVAAARRRGDRPFEMRPTLVVATALLAEERGHHE